MIDFERTSIGRAAYRMKLKDALFILMDEVMEHMDNSGRSATQKEIELLQAMMRVNKFIRSNPSNDVGKWEDYMGGNV